MNAQLIPKATRRKRQPTAAVMREQLRLAADEIIGLRTRIHWYEQHATAFAWTVPAGWTRIAHVARRRRLRAVLRALFASLVLVLFAIAARWAGWLPIGGAL